jgi:hypothetical protein
MAATPATLPSPSTTTRRRILPASITQVASYRLVSVATVRAGVVIASRAQQAPASLPAATTRTAMSRSVMVPIGRSSASTTGIIPQSFSIIIFATCGSGVSAWQQQGSAVITLAMSAMGRLRVGGGGTVGQRWSAEREAGADRHGAPAPGCARLGL